MIHQKRGGNAPWGLRIKRARDDFVSRLFKPPQASLLLRDEDDPSPKVRMLIMWIVKINKKHPLKLQSKRYTNKQNR